MRITFLSAVLVLTFTSLSNAQIKVVGNDYSLTGVKEYYDKDIDFDVLFPHLSPLEHRNIMGQSLWDNYYENLIGDTIFSVNISANVYKSTNGGESFNSIKQKVTLDGYYVIQGYVFAQENLDALGIKLYGRSINDLKERILTDNLGRDGLGYYIACVLLAPADTIKQKGIVFALEKDYNIWKDLHCLRYYNEAKKFIGYKVNIFLTRGYLEDWDKEKEGSIINDNLKLTSLKLLDEEFEVKDVVFNNGQFFLIMQGEATGSFAKTIKGFRTTYPRSLVFPEIVSIITDDYRIIKTTDYPLLIQKTDNEIQKARNKIEQEELELKKKEEEKTIDFRNKMISKYGIEKGSIVGNHQVAIGMTKEMCQDAWGAPLNTYRTTTKSGQEEVWSYNYKTRIYFYNGKVVQIDD